MSRWSDSPLTTSVWHRPLVPEEAKDRLAKRQANAAVALLRLEREQKVWPMLQHRPDPRTRSYLIHRFGPLDADPNQVLTQLDRQDDVSIRRALILTLGEFSEQQLPPAERERSIPRLLDLYANDPDPGIHGAVAWTLRRWGRQAELQRIDREFATGSPVGNRRWFVNQQGQTLVIIPPPGEFVIGSPPYEVGREGGPEGDVEMQRLRPHRPRLRNHDSSSDGGRVPRVSEGFFYRKYFLAGARLSDQQRHLVRRGRLLQLVERAGRHPEGTMVLPAERPGRVRRGDEDRPGLPRSAQVTVCRPRRNGNSPAGRFDHQSLLRPEPGPGQSLCLDRADSPGRGTASVGQFKPNDLGLFDMLGNILEWCHDAFRDHSQIDRGQPW